MATCDECGEYENLPYQCNRCGKSFCSTHRLPESHDCPGLNEWDDPSGVFESDFEESVSGATATSDTGVVDRIRARLDRELSTGGALGYFRGNAVYALLGAMWITFLLQFVVLALFGSTAFRSIFTLSTAHPEYVWTWFTSIFSHGSLYHIAANSIVVFFFGPLVERAIGSKKFTAFFLGSGAAAGLGYILFELGMGGSASVLGASGAAFAILGVLTVLRPNMEILLFFVIPMKLKVLTYGIAAISVLFVIQPSLAAAAGLAGVAHLAHLIGFAIGLAYGKRIEGNVRSTGRGPSVRGPRGPGGPGGRF
ncbi:MAG: rhomboid family intramembrane serine protease [Halopenitus sp.]